MSTTFAAANARHAKDVRILVTADSTRFSNGTIQSSTASHEQYIASVGSVGGSVRPNEGRSEIRAFSFSLLDVDGAVTTFLATDRRGASITAKIGYHDVDEADYEWLFQGLIVGYTWRNGVWTISCHDLRRSVKKTVFTGATAAAPVAITSENPIDTALSILTSTGAGTNGTYDTYDATDGLGIDDSLIDVTQFEKIRDDYFALESWTFAIREPVEALEFINNQITSILGCYLVTLADGKISLRIVKPPLFSDDTIALDNSNIVSIGMAQNLAMLVNEIAWKYDYDSSTDVYDSEEIYLNSTSLTAYGVTKQIELTSEAATGSLDAAFIEDRNDVITERYTDPFPVYSVIANLSVNQIDEGTIVTLAHNALPKLSDGTRGVTTADPILCEVLSVTVSPLKGRVTLQLINTGWSYGNKYGVIAYAGQNDYDSSTDAEKRKYVFIGDAANNYLGAANDDGFLIRP